MCCNIVCRLGSDGFENLKASRDGMKEDAAMVGGINSFLRYCTVHPDGAVLVPTVKACTSP